MRDEIRQIAHRIKELREIAGLSQETISREFGLSLENYRQYENGQADIPVSLLYEIGKKFNVELATLLTGEEPKLHTYCLVRKGEGVSVDRREEYDYESLAYNFVHKKAEPFLVTVEADAPDAPISFNAHPGQEFNYLLEGRMLVVVGDHQLELNEGDALYFDAGYRHGMKAIGHGPARFLAIIF